MLNLFSRKAKRPTHPLVQKIIVNSGLAAVDDIANPKDLIGLALVPPFAKHWKSFTKEEKRTLIRNYLSIYIHNILNADDFPRDTEIDTLLVKLGKCIRQLTGNAWFKLLVEYGESGKVPDKASFVKLPEHDQLELSGDRTEWDEKVVPILEEIAVCLDDNTSVEAWHDKRLAFF